ncbi:MAG: metalloregulator ArsR/SmtB family transcription factor [Sphingomicrobium sp.]
MTYGFAALADPMRQQIIERLAVRARSVAELAAEMPVTRPAVSQHLKVLKQAGLVRDRPEGTRRIYSIDRAGLHQLRSWLDRFWDDSLDAYAQAVDDLDKEDPKP